MYAEEKPLPPILYKYFPVESWLSLLLTGESLKFASRTTFNDPFDSRPAYKISDRKESLAWIKGKVAHIRNPAQRLLQQERLLSQSGKVRAFNQKESDRVLNGMGILCLSENWDNPLLWAHYAAKHTGICVGFHSNRDVFQTAEPVTYSPIRPVIERPRDDAWTILEKAFLTKDNCWSIEAEWRIIKRKLTHEEQEKQAQQRGDLKPEDMRVMSEQAGAGIYRFDPAAIESITMGMNISPDDEAMVLAAVRSALPCLPVFKTSPQTDKYPLKRKPVRLSHDPRLKRV